MAKTKGDSWDKGHQKSSSLGKVIVKEPLVSEETGKKDAGYARKE